MGVEERRPASGSGSCPVCRASLGLHSVRLDGQWFCSSACAEGEPKAAERQAAVPEPWLYARPRRFFRRRRPKELKNASSA